VPAGFRSRQKPIRNGAFGLHPLETAMAASLAICFKSNPRGSPNLKSGMLALRDAYYSTTKGADCAISCFEIVSFTLIVTLYFPG
jgi:hypothetical protein